jgi:hypothetical protein
MKKNWKLAGMLVVLSVLFSCNDDSIGPEIQEPRFYTFERNGTSTVDFTGQSQRIAMADQISKALLNPELSGEDLLAMYGHVAGQENFSTSELNNADKNLRTKTAASIDYFSSNVTTSVAIRNEFDSWLNGQASVFNSWNIDAQKGVAGQLQQFAGGPVRYLNTNGLEYNQIFLKSLMGAVMTDQMLNNYLSPNALDAGSNRETNNNAVLVEGKGYTEMEHKWDEAYGYIYGAASDASNSNQTIGQDDNFLNRYTGLVSNDPDFSGMTEEIFNAFKRGRAAIVAHNYLVRDQQAAIIKEKISLMIAIRTVYYLQTGKLALEAINVDYANTFHQLSEGIGFLYSLQFTQNPKTGAPYFSRMEVQDMIETIYPTSSGNDGFWDVTPADLQTVSEDVAALFDFTVAQAATVN